MIRTDAPSPILELEDINFGYNRNLLLRDISITVSDSETIAILGKSGAGKSSLLKCIACLESPEKGVVRLDGKIIVNRGKKLEDPHIIHRKIGLVFQGFHLFPNLRVRENITLALRHTLDLPKREANDIAVKVAEEFNIYSQLDRFPNELSGGQAQRAALARALVLKPRVLLLDEVTSSQDPETIQQMVSALHKVRLVAQQLASEDLPTRCGAIIAVTHLLPFAKSFADRILFLHEGEIIENCKSEELGSKNHPPEVIEYLDNAASLGML